MSKKSDSVFSYFRAVGEEWEAQKRAHIEGTKEWERRQIENDLRSAYFDTKSMGGGWE